MTHPITVEINMQVLVISAWQDQNKFAILQPLAQNTAPGKQTHSPANVVGSAVSVPKVFGELGGEREGDDTVNTKQQKERVMSKPESLMIDDTKYVRSDLLNAQAQTLDGLKYVIVRTQSAGVFAGYLESRTGQEVVLKNARRLWYWEGAASLSQLAEQGTSKPNSCKFPQEVSRIELLQAIEISDVTKKAQESIASVKVWTQ